MALANFTDLQTAIANYLARPGDVLVTAPAPDFITLAESRIAYGAEGQFASEPLRIRAMETSQTLVIIGTTAGGTVAGTANAITLANTTPVTSLVLGTSVALLATAVNTGATTLAADATATTAVTRGSARAALAGGEIVTGGNYKFYFDGTQWVLMPTSADVPLPSNYLAFRSVYLDVNPRSSLDYMTPAELNFEFAFGSTGQPGYFTIEEDALRFGYSPGGPYTANFLYYKKFPALATASTNWLMTNLPNVYLYASLLEAAIYFGIDDDIPKWQSLYAAACSGLATQDSRDRHSGPLQMRVRGMTP